MWPQFKTKQNKTKQNKTKQKKQNKTKPSSCSQGTGWELATGEAICSCNPKELILLQKREMPQSGCSRDPSGEADESLRRSTPSRGIAATRWPDLIQVSPEVAAMSIKLGRPMHQSFFSSFPFQGMTHSKEENLEITCFSGGGWSWNLGTIWRGVWNSKKELKS